MGAYSIVNNVLCFRAWNDPTNLLPGEVFFGSTPTTAQLTAAFPNYTVDSLAQAQAQQIATVNAQRDALEQGGFSYLGKTIQSDPISAQRIMYAAYAAQQDIDANQASSYTLVWTCADNSQLTMTAAQAVAMPIALAEYSQSLFTHAQGIKTAINEATTATAALALPTW